MPYVVLFRLGERVKVKIYNERNDAIDEANRLHDLIEEDDEEECSLKHSSNRWRNCDLTDALINIQEITMDSHSPLITKFQF